MPEPFSTAVASGLRSRFQREHHIAVKSLRGEKVRLLYDNMWAPVLTSIVAATLLVAALWPEVAHWKLIAWWGLLVVVSGIRLGLAYRFYRLPAAQQQRHRWLRRFSIGTVAAGCVWGLGSFELFDGDLPGQVAALSIVMAGISAGGVTTLSAVWWVSLGFVLPIMLPLLLQFLLHGSSLSILVGGMLVLFLGLMLVTSRRLSRIIHDNISLRVSMASREALLMESEDRYRSIFHQSPMGVMHFDEHGTVTDCNGKLLEILGVERAQLIGYCMLSPNADRAVASAVSDALRQGTGYYEGTYCLPNAPEGTPLRAFFNGVHSASQRMVGGVAMIEDFTERKRHEAIIYRQAYYDALTDLPNRRMFIEHLETLCAGDQHTSGLLLFMDLDRFKLINDTLGHAAGDDLLVQVARRLSASLQPGDMAARLSGDEFVLLALTETRTPEALEAWAEDYMQALQQALAPPYRLGAQVVEVTPSMGYACFQSWGCDHGDLLKQADLAMYQAKMEGRDRCRRYHPWMRDEAEKLAGSRTLQENAAK
ncbi:sensor domain-containing diguanylate cyclase [Halomonas sp. CUBES01]|uniref:Sensor domain-containing diguanylate cyclase n=1 Tax=Vreelandella gomseomensis TaxID=370766 RepID=A0ABU1GEK8_9GAMM|nr:MULTISPECIES: sensor domain-containing diguanylate cyclase [Halomonas]MDR5875915.1 sensor domain-containing diguanylate cyclase [Halomonas gomseomensis]MEC4766616.1 sensor domain-containing diguanylate cyclase [Halomonas sp. CUBES01]